MNPTDEEKTDFRDFVWFFLGAFAVLIDAWFLHLLPIYRLICS
jgi:hypothetical protein